MGPEREVSFIWKEYNYVILKSCDFREHRAKHGEEEDDTTADAEMSQMVCFCLFTIMEAYEDNKIDRAGPTSATFGDAKRMKRRHPEEFTKDGWWLGPMDQVSLLFKFSLSIRKTH